MFFSISFGERTKDWIDIISAFAPLIIGLGSIIIAIIANFLTVANLKQQTKQFSIQLKEERRNSNKQLALQKEQWLNDSYIKKEAIVVLRFRELILNSQNSFFWFANFFQPIIDFNKDSLVEISEENLIVKFDDYCLHYDKLNEINKFYNSNQLFIQKNGIEEEMNVIIAILSTFSVIKECEDFKYVLLYEDARIAKYKIDRIDKVCKKFVNHMKLLETFGDLSGFTNTDEEIKLYVDKILITYFQLKLKLDKIVTFYSDPSKRDMALSQSYFPTSEEWKNEIINVQKQ